MGIELGYTPDKYKKYEKYAVDITNFATIESCKIVISILILAVIVTIIGTIWVMIDGASLYYDDPGYVITHEIIAFAVMVAGVIAAIKFGNMILRTMHNIEVEELIQQDIAAGILIRTEDGQLILTEDLYKNDDKQ